MHSIARQKSSDFDKIRYKAADFEPSDSHVTKKIFYSRWQTNAILKTKYA